MVITEDELLATELEEATLEELEDTTDEETLLETVDELTALLEIEEVTLLEELAITEELEEATDDELAEAVEEEEDTATELILELLDDLELLKDEEISEKEKPPKLLLDELLEPSAKLKPAKLFLVEDFKELNCEFEALCNTETDGPLLDCFCFF